VTATDRDHLGTLRAIMSEWLRAIIGIRIGVLGGFIVVAALVLALRSA
jgi:hypothetical protein